MQCTLNLMLSPNANQNPSLDYSDEYWAMGETERVLSLSFDREKIPEKRYLHRVYYVSRHCKDIESALIHRGTSHPGWVKTHSKAEAGFLWLRSRHLVESLPSSAVLNHFRNMQVLTAKCLLHTQLRTAPDADSFFPRSYCIPEDQQAFETDFQLTKVTRSARPSRVHCQCSVGRK